MPTSDLNATKNLNVIDNLDMNLPATIQTFLTPIYQKYPFLAETLLSIPFANLIAAFFVLSLFLLLRKFFTSIVIGFFKKLASYTKTRYDDEVISALMAPISFAIILIGFHLFFCIDL